MNDFNPTHLLRCPDCTHGSLKEGSDTAHAAQGRSACPECNRGMGVLDLETVGEDMLAEYIEDETLIDAGFGHITPTTQEAV